MLARNVDREQEEEERRTLQRSWEMATILDFLELFRPYLNWDEVADAPGFSPERVWDLRQSGATLGPPPASLPLLAIDRRDLQH